MRQIKKDLQKTKISPFYRTQIKNLNLDLSQAIIILYHRKNFLIKNLNKIPGNGGGTITN